MRNNRSTTSSLSSSSSSSSCYCSWRPTIRFRYLTLIIGLFLVVTVFLSHLVLHQQQQHQQQQQFPTALAAFLNRPPRPPPRPITIGYAISITACGNDEHDDVVANTAQQLDGAAILRFSIQRFDNEWYQSKFHAFVHPSAQSCAAATLQRMGYTVSIVPTPINTTDIRGPLQEYVEGASCCGSKEFLKLYAYTLIQYPIVVHFDIDVLVLQPLHDLFDSMLLSSSLLKKKKNDDADNNNYNSSTQQKVAAVARRRRLPIVRMWEDIPLPDTINAFFTKDYNMMAHPGFRTSTELSMQGGFLVLRPSMDVFHEFVEIILDGQYHPDFGWGAPNYRFGGTYGAAQIQGLIAYYYGRVHPHTAVELNRCIYNNMVDEPRFVKTGECMAPTTKEESCEDCRLTNLSLIKTTHYTICQKPWHCHSHFIQKLCRQLHHEWFQVRYQMELTLKARNSSYVMSAEMNRQYRQPEPFVVHNASFCTANHKYIRLQQYPP